MESINIWSKVTHLPPIRIKGIINKSDLCTNFIKLNGIDNFCYQSSTNCFKITTTNPNSYRTQVHFLRDQKAEFHIFQLKEDKPKIDGYSFKKPYHVINTKQRRDDYK